MANRFSFFFSSLLLPFHNITVALLLLMAMKLTSSSLVSFFFVFSFPTWKLFFPRNNDLETLVIVILLLPDASHFQGKTNKKTTNSIKSPKKKKEK